MASSCAVGEPTTPVAGDKVVPREAALTNVEDITPKKSAKSQPALPSGACSKQPPQGPPQAQKPPSVKPATAKKRKSQSRLSEEARKAFLDKRVESAKKRNLKVAIRPGAGTSIYSGVHKHTNGRWSASIRLDGASLYIGLFDTETLAAKAIRRAEASKDKLRREQKEKKNIKAMDMVLAKDPEAKGLKKRMVCLREEVKALREKHAALIPKQPLTAFFVFSKMERDRIVAEMRAEVKAAGGSNSFSSTLVTKRLAETWQALDKEGKKPFEERAATALAEHRAQWASWEQTPEFAKLQRAERELRETKEKAQAKMKGVKATAAVAPAASASASAAARSRKASAATVALSARPAKVRRGTSAAPGIAAAGPQVDEAVLADARRKGFEGVFRTLANRADIRATGVEPKKLLEALVKAGGLLHKAKDAVLSAAGVSGGPGAAF